MPATPVAGTMSLLLPVGSCVKKSPANSTMNCVQLFIKMGAACAALRLVNGLVGNGSQRNRPAGSEIGVVTFCGLHGSTFHQSWYVILGVFAGAPRSR